MTYMLKLFFLIYYCVNLQAYYTIDFRQMNVFLAFIENVFHIKVNQQPISI
jgi:hypothetical protein